jgi:hypothetical protein
MQGEGEYNGISYYYQVCTWNAFHLYVYCDSKYNLTKKKGNPIFDPYFCKKHLIERPCTCFDYDTYDEDTDDWADVNKWILNNPMIANRCGEYIKHGNNSNEFPQFPQFINNWVSIDTLLEHPKYMMVDGEDDIVSNEEGKRIKKDMDYIHEKLLLEKINFYKNKLLTGVLKVKYVYREVELFVFNYTDNEVLRNTFLLPFDPSINFVWTSQTFDESLIPEILVEPWNLSRTDLRLLKSG